MGAPARCRGPQRHIGCLQGEKGAAAGVCRILERRCVLDLSAVFPTVCVQGQGRPVRTGALWSLQLRPMRTGTTFARNQLTPTKNIPQLGSFFILPKVQDLTT